MYINKNCIRDNTLLITFTIVFTTSILIFLAFTTHSKYQTSIELDCSGHGFIFPDSPEECSCYGCWSGNQCETYGENCRLSIGGGTSYVLQVYWNEHPTPVTTTPLNYRVGYQFSLSEYYSESHTVGLAGKLNQAIRFLHKKYRNFNPDGKYLIFGNGVIDLTINLFRTWSETEGKALYTYLNAPYFYQLPNHCNSANFACVPTQNETLDPSEVTEWVVVPNNPDGKITSLPHYNTKMWAKDLVYYWPHLSGVGYNMVTDDSPIAVFSFTKFTGHAGVRFGWAFVSDITLAQDLAYRIRRNVYHYSASNLYHALTIINDINANGIRFFDWAIALLQSRWSRYESMLAQQSVFKVESVRGTQYLWLSSGGRTEEELVDAFYEVKISPMFGNSFGSPGYVRINMLEFEDVFTAGLEGVLRVAQLLDRKYIDDEL